MRRGGPAAALALGLLTMSAMAQPVDIPVRIDGPQGPLAGSLRETADGSAPVVLIVPGSGPTDRDGNNPLGVRAAPYRLLAEGLAGRGIATLRIDKRGMFGSEGAVADANAVKLGDYADDLRSWIDFLIQRRGSGCVWLLGHSEGGLVALLAAQRPQGVCGLILAATPGRPLAAILRRQFSANTANAPLLDQALAAIADLERGRKVDASALHPALRKLFDPAVQGFLMDAMSVDPAALIRGMSRPILILQGASDLQVGTDDAERLASAQPAARLSILPDVNHVLKTAPAGDRNANLATYADAALPLAPGVVDAVARFVTIGR